MKSIFSPQDVHKIGGLQRQDVAAFAERWIYGRGTPSITGKFLYNKKVLKLGQAWAEMFSRPNSHWSFGRWMKLIFSPQAVHPQFPLVFRPVDEIDLLAAGRTSSSHSSRRGATRR